MSKQIQIRRGTAAEHASFTGAIGEITMDTTNNTLRVHDGTTAGGTILAKQSEIPTPYTMPDNYDFVVDCQMPTAENGYIWYRKYKSGWIEQGGRATTTSSNPKEITLPVEMADTYYNINLLGQTSTDGYQNAQWQMMSLASTAHPKTKTSFYAQPSLTGYNLFFYWEVRGIAADQS